MVKYEAQLEFQTEAELGEGPVWDDGSNRLWWVDILGCNLNRYDPKTGRNKSFDIGEHIGAAVLREKGGLVLALKSGFAFFNPETGAIKKIADPEAHLQGSRFNDGKCDPAGRFWAGTLAYNLEEGAGSLYCLHPDLRIERKLEQVTISNGLAWNEKTDTFFFIDTPTHEIISFSFDQQAGKISNRSLVYRFDENDGYPDGMAIDEKGCLWVALYNGSRVVCIDPKQKKTVAEIKLPVPKPTSCAFGGKNLDELYITTCREHMNDDEIEKHPLSGSIFKAELPVRGIPVHAFSG